MTRTVHVALVAACVAGGAIATLTVAPATAKSLLDQATAASGTKEALSRASDAVVDRLGKSGGFWNDPAVRIPLPGPLDKVRGLLKLTDKVGLTKGLHQSLNTAAENAMPAVRPLLKKTISEMSVADAIGIVTGGDTAATDYFKAKTGDDLEAAMRPTIGKSLDGVKAYDQLDKVIKKAKLPIKGLSKDDLTGFVTDKAADGVYHYLAVEEKAIRANPLKTGSKLLKTVFGG